VDLDGNELDHNALTTAIASGRGFELLMVYSRLEELSKDFFLSGLSADLREMILASVKEYEPKREINLLLRRPDGSLRSFVGSFCAWRIHVRYPAEFHAANQKGMSPADFYNANRHRKLLVN